jgi:hypothetical protein
MLWLVIINLFWIFSTGSLFVPGYTKDIFPGLIPGIAFFCSGRFVQNNYIFYDCLVKGTVPGKAYCPCPYQKTGKKYLHYLTKVVCFQVKVYKDNNAKGGMCLSWHGNCFDILRMEYFFVICWHIKQC